MMIGIPLMYHNNASFTVQFVVVTVPATVASRMDTAVLRADGGITVAKAFMS